MCELIRKIASQLHISRRMGVLKSVDRRDAGSVRYRRNPSLALVVAAIVEAVMAALPESEREAA